MPEIIWYGTNGNNFWPGFYDRAAIVDHVMDRAADGSLATIDSVKNWFSSPKSEVSAHFGVSRAGKIVQYVATNNSAWGNGILENPDLEIPWLAESVKNKINPNRRTISIEHEGDGRIAFTQDQFEATLWLHRKLIRDFKIKPDDKHIIGHNRITGIQRANCPGRAFPWSRLFEEVKMDRTFNSNGHQVAEPFASYYEANGGLPVFGLALGESEGYIKNPDVVKVQWFERARLELHRDGQIMRGLVGAEALVCRGS